VGFTDMVGKMSARERLVGVRKKSYNNICKCHTLHTICGNCKTFVL